MMRVKPILRSKPREVVVTHFDITDRRLAEIKLLDKQNELDAALLKLLAAEGLGVAPVADSVLQDLEDRYGLHVVGRLNDVAIQFYAISVERKVTHPAVITILDAAKRRLFRHNS